MNYKLNFYTQYHQFFISDKEAEKRTEEGDFWTELATNLRLAVGEGILGVGLECYGPFKGELVFLDTKNEQKDLDQYDHVVEGGLNVKSGTLQILDCPNFNIELEVEVKPGTYRARIYSSNLSSVVEDSGDDFYKIEMWPDRNMERVVLKQYSGVG